jgi:all-trans-retinol 13,14-reductase
MTTTFSETALDAFLKQLKKPLDCVIVGSGASGLTAASLLVQAGVSVVVLERAPQMGGATHAFTESGYEFEMGLQEVGI